MKPEGNPVYTYPNHFEGNPKDGYKALCWRKATFARSKSLFLQIPTWRRYECPLVAPTWDCDHGVDVHQLRVESHVRLRALGIMILYLETKMDLTIRGLVDAYTFAWFFKLWNPNNPDVVSVIQLDLTYPVSLCLSQWDLVNRLQHRWASIVSRSHAANEDPDERCSASFVKSTQSKYVLMSSAEVQTSQILTIGKATETLQHATLDWWWRLLSSPAQHNNSWEYHTTLPSEICYHKYSRQGKQPVDVLLTSLLSVKPSVGYAINPSQLNESKS